MTGPAFTSQAIGCRFACALRALAHRPLHVAITLTGLAVGFFAAILILLFVRDETGFDRFFSHPDDLYRIVVTYKVPGRDPIDLASSPPPAGPGLAGALPEITHMARMIYQGETFDVDGRVFTDTVSYVDPAFLDIFDFPLLAGDPAAALDRPDGLILTQSLAERYFPGRPALGQTVLVRRFNEPGLTRLTVTGVMADLPADTHLLFTALAPISAPSNGWPAQAYDEWATGNLLTYVRVRPGTDGAAFQKRVRAWSEAAIPDIEMMGATLRAGRFAELTAQSVPGIHLTSNRRGEVRPPGSLLTVMALSAAAAAILVIAIMNFANMATVQAVQRAKEMSIRKVLGARPGDLAVQLFIEALAVTLAALVIAVAGVELALPLFNDFVNKDLAPPYAAPGLMLLLLILAGLAAGAGAAYPAITATRFDPVAVLKGERATGGMTRLQTVLVITQFAAAVTLISATLVVTGQTTFAKTIDIGWHKDGMIVVSGMGREPAVERVRAYRDRLVETPSVSGVTFSTSVPTEDWEGNVFVQRADDISDDGSTLMRILTVARNFFDVYDIGVAAALPGALAGDPLGPAPLGERQVAINEAAAYAMGYDTPGDALGAMIYIGVRTPQSTPSRIAAIVRNTHFHSIRQPIVPTLYALASDGFWDMTVRTAPGRRPAAVAAIDGIWQDLMDGSAIQRRDIADSFARLYAAEDRQGLLLALFAMLTLFVACLGLFGLAALTAERRTKEIGIRKALGASTAHVLGLMMWRFAKPVLIANLIAWPLAYGLMAAWLDGFAYRIVLHPGYFLAASVLTLIIALITVLAHGWRVASAPPAGALRYE